MSNCVVCNQSFERDQRLSLTLGGNICPKCKSKMNDELEAEKEQLKRRDAERKACRDIPTAALEAGVIEKIVGVFKRSEYLTVCPWCQISRKDGQHLSFCELGQILTMLEGKQSACADEMEGSL